MKPETLEAIASEQDYQQKKWPGRNHSTGEWIVILHQLLITANSEWVTKSGDGPALDIIRKIAATAASCMDQNGAVKR